MRRLKKILLSILVILLVIAIIVPTVGYFAVVRPALPQLDNELKLSDLTAPVTVYRDASGIPHIVPKTRMTCFTRRDLSPRKTDSGRWNPNAAPRTELSAKSSVSAD